MRDPEFVIPKPKIEIVPRSQLHPHLAPTSQQRILKTRNAER